MPPKLLEYDISGVEESSGGTGVKVKQGVMPAKIMLAEYRDKKKDGTPANDIRLGLSVGDEYDWLFTYISLEEAADWKLAEFIRALNLKEKGKLNLDRDVKGKVIRVKVNPGTYNGEYSPEVGRLMKAQPGDDEAIGQSVTDKGTSQGGASDDGPVDDDPTASGADETGSTLPERDADGDPIYENGFEASRESDPEVGSYDDWDEDDLLGEVQDRGLTLPGGRGKKKDKAIAALRAEDAEVEGASAGAAVEDDSGDDDAGEDYSSWDLDKLKAEWADRNLGDLPNVRGSGAADRLRKAITEELVKDDAENPFTP